jgi:hypothetical protein
VARILKVLKRTIDEAQALIDSGKVSEEETRAIERKKTLLDIEAGTMGHDVKFDRVAMRKAKAKRVNCSCCADRAISGCVACKAKGKMKFLCKRHLFTDTGQPLCVYCHHEQLKLNEAIQKKGAEMGGNLAFVK